MGLQFNATPAGSWQGPYSSSLQVTWSRVPGWVSGSGWPTGVPCYYNSELSTESVSPGTNAILTIKLRLWLEQRDKRHLHEVRWVPQVDDLLSDWHPGEFAEFS